MHHIAKISFGKAELRPFHAECACGTAGDFSDHGEARNYLAMHLARLQGINSAEFADETHAAIPVPEESPAPAPDPPAPEPEGHE